MRNSIWKRLGALALVLCLLCGSAALAANYDKATIKAVQQALNDAGFDCGTPDGIAGKNTTAAIKAYQEAHGMNATGAINGDLLDAMGIADPNAHPPVTTTEFSKQFTSDAIVDGTLLSILDTCCYICDIDLVSGWMNMRTRDKGDGIPIYTQNFLTGQEIRGCQGAETYLCDEGVLELEWIDPEGNGVIDPYDILHYETDMGEPQTYGLVARYYDDAGTVVEERHLLDYTQTTKDVYFSKIYPPIEKVNREFGVHSPYMSQKYADVARDLGFVDVDGDAVCYSPEGVELIRYPNTAPEQLTVALLNNGMALSVTRYDSRTTEIFALN